MLGNKEDIPPLFQKKLRSRKNYHASSSKGFSEVNCVTTHKIPDKVGVDLLKGQPPFPPNVSINPSLSKKFPPPPRKQILFININEQDQT